MAAAPPSQSSGFANVPTPRAATVCEQFELDDEAPAGTVVARDGDAAVVACGEGGLVLEEVEGAAEPLPVGARLG